MEFGKNLLLKKKPFDTVESEEESLKVKDRKRSEKENGGKDEMCEF